MFLGPTNDNVGEGEVMARLQVSMEAMTWHYRSLTVVRVVSQCSLPRQMEVSRIADGRLCATFKT
jgi:hypothetical protein